MSGVYSGDLCLVPDLGVKISPKVAVAPVKSFIGESLAPVLDLEFDGDVISSFYSANTSFSLICAGGMSGVGACFGLIFYIFFLSALV